MSEDKETSRPNIQIQQFPRAVTFEFVYNWTIDLNVFWHSNWTELTVTHVIHRLLQHQYDDTIVLQLFSFPFGKRNPKKEVVGLSFLWHQILKKREKKNRMSSGHDLREAKRCLYLNGQCDIIVTFMANSTMSGDL